MNIYVFETKSEIDDSELKKYFGSKGKKMRNEEIIVENIQVFNGYPCKNFAKYFCIVFCFRTF